MKEIVIPGKFLPFALLMLSIAIVVTICGLILGGSLLDANFISTVIGITIAIFFIVWFIVSIIFACKLLPRQTKMESVDGGETWMVVKEKERSK